MIPFFSKMQKKNFVHRDIKPDNILIAKNTQKGYSYKIADFGFAVRLSKYSSQNIAGTMEYASPKLLEKFKDSRITVPGHHFKDDVYSLGKTIFEFMSLEINGVLSTKKTQLIENKYGSKYSILVMMMLKPK
jgi:serine/threonine protein kinase